MTALVHGAGRTDRGTELLLAAVAERARGWPEPLRPAVPVHGGTGGPRPGGACAHVSVARLGTAADLGLGLVPAPVRGRLGLSVDADLRAVLDASGFLLSDRCGPAAARHALVRARHWRALGVPILLLPQVFGPFDDPAVAGLAAEVVRAADAVFCRDPASLGHVRQLLAGAGADPERARLAPDLTVGFEVPGRGSPDAMPIIPSWGIARRAASRERRACYLRSLEAAVRVARRAGLDPYGLCHGGAADLRLLRELRATFPDLRIVAGRSGPGCRALLAGCRLVLSGRYDGAVSALSSAVPAVLHGWPEEYRQLAAEFRVGPPAVDPFDPGATADAVRQVLADGTAPDRLSAAGRVQRDRVEQTWRQVEAVLFAVVGPGRDAR